MTWEQHQTTLTATCPATCNTPETAGAQPEQPAAEAAGSRHLTGELHRPNRQTGFHSRPSRQEGRGSCRTRSSAEIAGASKLAGRAARSTTTRGRGVGQGRRAAGRAQQPTGPKSQKNSRKHNHK
jgi:hypothetical protein